MEQVIQVLKNLREEYKQSFVEKSITEQETHNNNPAYSNPIPDTQHDLQMIIELNKAISTLENNNNDIIKTYGKSI